MSERIRIRYNFEGIEQWEAVQQQLREIIQQDTGEEAWVETRSLPPMGFPPPLTSGCVDKLKELGGVVVNEIEE